MTPSARLPAAAYVRMSTEHQQYSTTNQLDRINAFASARGMDVVQIFADEGKSGLQVRGRESLQRLIAAVQSGQAEFRAILVYDISRWGRFQDADESGYYEYLCRQAGIAVHYCAEQFENDGSPASNIIKSVKRSMAGEYSRELSTKVFQGACRLIRLGFAQGGTAILGLRRMRIDAAGQPQGILERGQHKALTTDRVILVPGPEAEQALVRRIFEAFVNGQPERAIADALNQESPASDRPWGPARVREILTNEKYIGNLIYNKTSFKLQRRFVLNPPDLWIRAEAAFPAIVDPRIFARAQEILQARRVRYSEEELLTALRACLARHGRVSAPVIDRDPATPPSRVYRRWFGSLLLVYQRIGLDVRRALAVLAARRKERSCQTEVIAMLAQTFVVQGLSIEQNENLVRIAEEWTLAIIVIRCRLTTRRQTAFWAVAPHPQADLTVAVRLREDNEHVHDYFLFPALDRPGSVHLRSHNNVLLDAYRFGSLDPLLALAARVSVEEAA